MKTIKSKLAILVSAICSGALLVASGLSAAWFYRENNIDLDDGLTGSVLQKYFHDGDGSKDHPFIITRPRHYENMVLLHYNLEGFAEKEFYFEIGTDLDGDPNTIEVYNYKDGKVDNSVGNGYSTTLNCDRIASLAPLGSLKKPFNAHIDGNNMTVSGFHIDATRDKFMDIGIFGFVGHGTCLNTYFSDFVIDTTGTEYKEPTAAEIENDTAHIHQKGAVHFGYIAGHLDETGNFQNVYVNNCTLKGTTNGLHVNNYGYYGRAEQDALGGGLGVGRDYQFSLNSQAVFNYFNTTYDTIKDQQLVLRNTRATYNETPNDNGDKVKRITTDGQHIVPFSQAVAPDTAAGSGTYLIQDGYSLSTSGYASPEFVEQRHDYNVYYQDREYMDNDGDDRSHDGTIKAPVNQPIYYDHSLRGSGEGLIVNTDTREEAPTPYYYWNDTKKCFMYGESFDRKVIAGYDEYYFDLKLNDFSFEIDEDKTSLDTKKVQVDARLYFDDEDYNGKHYLNMPMTVTETHVRSGWLFVTFYKYTLHFTMDPVRLPRKVQEGNHKYSVVFSFTYPYGNGTRRASYVYGNYSANNNYLGQKTVVVNNALDGINLDVNSGFTKIDSTTDTTNYDEIINANNNKIERVHFVFNPDEVVNHVDPRTFETPLLFKEVIDGVEQDGFTTIQELNETYHTSFLYTPGFNGNLPVWKLVIVRRDVLQNPETKEYFVSEETLVYESGYRAKNIDVVGGGAEFYYQNLLNGRVEIAVLSLTSEKTAGEFVGPAPAKGSLFFANESCKSSIVVYLKNTSNAVDGRNDALGKISFTYVQATILGYSLDLVDPSFKKGNEFLSLKKAGTNIVESEDTGFINLTHNISLDLMEDDVQKVSYCALDAEGRVLGTYKSDGTTTMTKEEQVKIDTYVLVLGGQSDRGNDTWITNIDFEYKAQDGFGGSFGQIGYRDATDTIDNTILNFYLENPTVAGDYVDYTYLTNVRYVKNENYVEGEEGSKAGTYYITCYADKEVVLKIYNYYSSIYDVYVKSTPTGEFEAAGGQTPIVSIPASQESTW